MQSLRFSLLAYFSPELGIDLAELHLLVLFRGVVLEDMACVVKQIGYAHDDLIISVAVIMLNRRFCVVISVICRALDMLFEFLKIV